MSIEPSEPIAVFQYALKASETKRQYTKTIERFFDFVGLDGTLNEKASSFVSKGRNDNNWVFANVMKFMVFQKERAERGEISQATVRNYWKPVKLFMEMNDVPLPAKKISRGIPKGRQFAIDRAPTLEEIKKIVQYPDRRIKAIVYTMCSSSIRVGSWEFFKWKHVIPLKRNGKVVAAKLVVYGGEEDQYFTFISPEAFTELNNWMKFRESSGENITGESWIMRNLWDTIELGRGMISVPIKLEPSGIKRMIERSLKSQGIRKKLPPGQKRHEFQTDHGFRKWFKSRAEQVMKPINVEILMGHSVGVSDSYYRPNENELLDDYLKAVPSLTISDGKKLEAENMILKNKNSEFEIKEQKIKTLENNQEKLIRRIERLEKGKKSKEVKGPV